MHPFFIEKELILIVDNRFAANNNKNKGNQNKDLVNENIRFPEVLLIGPNGEQLGVMSSREAQFKANDYDLDLLCVAPNAKPPVCKIINYSKYRFEQQKKAKEAKRNQKTTEVKELRLGIFTEEHDLDTKAVLAAKFLEGGDKVKISMRFRGREMGYANKGRENMLKFCDMVKDLGRIEKQPILEGRNMSMIIAPKTEKEKEKEAKAARQKAKENGETQAAQQ